MEAIPITRPLTGDEEAAAAAEVIRSGWLTQGPKTSEFEKAVAAYVGSDHAAATSNCTTALMLALEAVGVGAGDEVITSPYSFIATANAVVSRGAQPVFADIDPATFNLRPDLAAEKITSRTKAIMPVDQLGLPCDLDGFLRLADGAGIALIEDAACALGSEYKGRLLGGGLGRNQLACFSFHPRKVITTGEGGMVTGNDAELAEKIRMLASHGASIPEIRKHESRGFLAPAFPIPGYNYRLSDILAAVGLAQMKRLEGILARRRELAAQYDAAFGGHARIRPPFVPDWARPNYQSYQVRIEGSSRVERDRIVNRLREIGVMATPGVADIHRQGAYVRRIGPVRLPAAEMAADTSIILPLFPQMAEADLDRSAEALIGLAV